MCPQLWEPCVDVGGEAVPSLWEPAPSAPRDSEVPLLHFCEHYPVPAHGLQQTVGYTCFWRGTGSPFQGHHKPPSPRHGNGEDVLLQGSLQWAQPLRMVLHPSPPTAAKQPSLCYPGLSRHLAQVKHSFKHFAVLYCEVDLKTTQQTTTSLFVPCRSQQAVQPWAPGTGRSRGSSSALADQGLCLQHQHFWVFNPISAHAKPCLAWELWCNQLQYG